MGTITTRTRSDKSIGYTAQIRLKRGGKVIHTEAKTFDRRPAAEAWMTKRERELAQPGALETISQNDPTLADVIDRYVRESRRELGRTKAQVLQTISVAPIGGRNCSEITSSVIVEFAHGLGVQPQTVGNYISHLASVFVVARPAWGYPLDMKAMQDARVVLKKLGSVSKSKKRDRRPTVDELDRLMKYFQKSRAARGDTVPMMAMVAMTLFSMRREEEICRIEWKDLDEEGCRVMVRDLKHPGEKQGNDQWCDLTPEALRVVMAQPRTEKRIFPHKARSVSSAFTRAVQVIGIDDLHMNDLRHEGASRLTEMGWSIQRVAAVTGHRSWATLKRYTHHRQVGDKWADWQWLDVIAAPQTTPAS
jgi:integrase